MVDLRKLARDRNCEIRVPGGCAPVDTVVLCHARIIGISGAGMKVPDLLAAFGCFRCHAIVDGQQKSDYTAEQRRLMLLEGMARTQAILIREDIIKW